MCSKLPLHIAFRAFLFKRQLIWEVMTYIVVRVFHFIEYHFAPIFIRPLKLDRRSRTSEWIPHPPGDKRKAKGGISKKKKRKEKKLVKIDMIWFISAFKVFAGCKHLFVGLPRSVGRSRLSSTSVWAEPLLPACCQAIFPQNPRHLSYMPVCPCAPGLSGSLQQHTNKQTALPESLWAFCIFH